MHRFTLKRIVDATGVSGTGKVAEGVVFSDGTVALRWTSNTPSTVFYAKLDDLKTVHLHGGLSQLVWIDEETGEDDKDIDK